MTFFLFFEKMSQSAINLKRAFQPRKNSKEHEKPVTYRSSVNHQNGEIRKIGNTLFFRVIFVFIRGQLRFLGSIVVAMTVGRHSKFP
jgi:NADH:ubiquinone oxidoreductase subunit 6 (subunit J)